MRVYLFHFILVASHIQQYLNITYFGSLYVSVCFPCSGAVHLSSQILRWCSNSLRYYMWIVEHRNLLRMIAFRVKVLSDGYSMASHLGQGHDDCNDHAGCKSDWTWPKRDGL